MYYYMKPKFDEYISKNNFEMLDKEPIKGDTGSWCEDLNKSNQKFDKPKDLATIIDNRHHKRLALIRSLNDINVIQTHGGKRFYYPNFELFSNYSTYFNADDKCLCNFEIWALGKETSDKTKNIYLGAIFGQGAVGTAMLVYIGGKEYIAKQIKGIAPTTYVSLYNQDLSTINPLHKKYNPCIEYNQVNAVYDNDEKPVLLNALGDNFVNQTFIHMILHEILGKTQYESNYVYQYDAFYCDVDGNYTDWNIMEFCQEGDMADYISNDKTNISEEWMIDMLVQLFAPLNILKCKKYGFVHGDMKCRNVFVDYDVDKKKHVFKLADFDKSSIFWKGVRFSTYNYGIQNPFFYEGYVAMSYKNINEYVNNITNEKNMNDVIKDIIIEGTDDNVTKEMIKNENVDDVVEKNVDGDVKVVVKNEIDALDCYVEPTEQTINANIEDANAFFKRIVTSTEQERKGTEELYYTLGNFIPAQAFIMTHWCPMHMSYDYYSFIISLLGEPKIWKYYNEKKNLY